MQSMFKNTTEMKYEHMLDPPIKINVPWKITLCESLSCMHSKVTRFHFINKHDIEQQDGTNYVILGWIETANMAANLCHLMLAQRYQS
jgi:hypothetical protein